MYDTLIEHPLTQSHSAACSWVDFISVAYAWRCGRTQLFGLQPSVNLHAQLQPLCSAALVPNVLPRRDEGSGEPCAVIEAFHPLWILSTCVPPPLNIVYLHSTPSEYCLPAFHSLWILSTCVPPPLNIVYLRSTLSEYCLPAFHPLWILSTCVPPPLNIVNLCSTPSEYCLPAFHPLWILSTCVPPPLNIVYLHSTPSEYCPF